MPMSPTALKAMLAAEKNAALGLNSSKLAEERSRALDYYMGDVSRDMPSVDGRSVAVSNDVSDTVEGLMPSLMEIFASSEEVVRFEPVGQEDEEAADQESDYVNHVFMQKNPGFLILYSFIKDALLSKVGIVKVDWDKSEKEERETYLDQPDDAFAALAASPDMEIAEHTERVDETTGQKVHDVTLVKRRAYGCAKAMGVPPEEFGISKRAKSIHDAHYVYHEVIRTESELIEQGYDPAHVKTLPSSSEKNETEHQSRDTVEEELTEDETLNRAMRPIRVTEHYIRMDYEETKDSKAQLYRVTTGGDDLEVLRRDGKPDVVPVDIMPFAAMTPVIVTHRFFGRSIADLVLDIQQIKTALLRGLLDNIYLLNNQRYEVAESHAHERTLDDLLVNRPGGVIRTKIPGGLVPIQNQPIGQALFPAIEYMDATREWRTGVTRQGQGLSPDSLQNVGERAILDAMNAARAKTKLIARIFAETGIRDLFSLLHGVIRKNDNQVNTVRLRNKWVQVDPRTWKTREDMTVNVGLGSGSNEQQVMHLMTVLGLQKEAIAVPQLGLVKPKNIYNTAEKLIEKIGLKTIEPYFTDPEEIDPATGQPKQPPPPPPDPEMVKLQVEAQLAEKADERKAQIEQVQAQADMATNQQKMQADAAAKEREYQLKERMALLQAEIDREKFNREEARKDREHEQKLALTRETHEASLRQGMQAHDHKMAEQMAGNAVKTVKIIRGEKGIEGAEVR